MIISGYHVDAKFLACKLSFCPNIFVGYCLTELGHLSMIVQRLMQRKTQHNNHSRMGLFHKCKKCGFHLGKNVPFTALTLVYYFVHLPDNGKTLFIRL